MFVVKKSGCVVGTDANAELENVCAFIRRIDAIHYLSSVVCESARQLCDLCIPEQTTIIDLGANMPVITITVTADARIVLLANGGYVGNWKLSERSPFDLNEGLRELSQFLSSTIWNNLVARCHVYDPMVAVVRTVNVLDGSIVRHFFGIYVEDKFEDLLFV